jgi:phytoene dehydrogenase-like protein
MNGTKERYDVIIIGSGISGLTCASLLSQFGKQRILVLERHFKPGGFTHVFRRNARNTYEWDVGLHYVGEMMTGSLPRAIFDFIGRGGIRWQALPDEYDVFVFPDTIFKAIKGQKQFEEALVSKFPSEKIALAQYFKDLKKAAAWYLRLLIASMLPLGLGKVGNLLRKMGSGLALQTTGAYLNRLFKNEKLKAILASQWGDYGLPPNQSAFVIHALVASHYLNGGYYPVGGGKIIADSIIPEIERHGGQVLVNHEVDTIVNDGERVIGVTVTHHKKSGDVKESFNAPVIISAAGAYNTYVQLLSGMFEDKFRNFKKGTASVNLYVGLTEDPGKLGLKGENHWLFTSYNHDEMYQKRNDLIDGQVTHCYVSFPSLKNPPALSHTMEIIAFIDTEPFSRWADKPWKNRGPDYDALKQRISTALLEFVERKIPGITKIVDYMELSTPLSTFFFTGHPDGTIYGLPATPERYQNNWLGIRTPFSNLFLTGTDATGHGIVGAMWGGVLTAGTVMGLPMSLFKIINTCRKYSRELHRH